MSRSRRAAPCRPALHDSIHTPLAPHSDPLRCRCCRALPGDMRKSPAEMVTPQHPSMQNTQQEWTEWAAAASMPTAAQMYAIMRGLGIIMPTPPAPLGGHNG